MSFDEAAYQREYYQRNKECLRAAQAEYRAKNLDAIREQQRQWRAENKDEIYARRNKELIRDGYERNKAHVNAIKAAGSCADCGESYPPPAMDFDHVRGEKRDDVARLVGARCALKTLDEEIAKCDLVCANCHRIRHHVEREKAA